MVLTLGVMESANQLWAQPPVAPAQSDRQTPAASPGEKQQSELRQRLQAQAQLRIMELQRRQLEEQGNEQIHQLQQQGAEQIEQVKAEADRQVQQLKKQVHRQIEQVRRQLKRQLDLQDAQIQLVEAQTGILSPAMKPSQPTDDGQAQVPESGGKTKHSAVASATDQKLDRLLERLECLEKLLEKLEGKR